VLDAPQPPPERSVLDLPLLWLDVAPGRIAGEYRAFFDGSCVLHVRVPHGVTGLTATVRGQAIDASHLDGLGLAIRLNFSAGDRVPFEVQWDT
jgi:hypothetical protein